MAKPWLASISSDDLMVDDDTPAPALEEEVQQPVGRSISSLGVPIAPSRPRSLPGTPEACVKAVGSPSSKSGQRPPMRRTKTRADSSRGLAISDIVNYRTSLEPNRAPADVLLRDVHPLPYFSNYRKQHIFDRTHCRQMLPDTLVSLWPLPLQSQSGIVRSPQQSPTDMVFSTRPTSLRSTIGKFSVQKPTPRAHSGLHLRLFTSPMRTASGAISTQTIRKLGGRRVVRTTGKALSLPP